MVEEGRSWRIRNEIANVRARGGARVERAQSGGHGAGQVADGGLHRGGPVSSPRPTPEPICENISQTSAHVFLTGCANNIYFLREFITIQAELRGSGLSRPVRQRNAKDAHALRRLIFCSALQARARSSCTSDDHFFLKIPLYTE